jgi:hypothetical protein
MYLNLEGKLGPQGSVERSNAMPEGGMLVQGALGGADQLPPLPPMGRSFLAPLPAPSAVECEGCSVGAERIVVQGRCTCESRVGVQANCARMCLLGLERRRHLFCWVSSRGGGDGCLTAAVTKCTPRRGGWAQSDREAAAPPALPAHAHHWYLLEWRRHGFDGFHFLARRCSTMSKNGHRPRPHNDCVVPIVYQLLVTCF